MGELYLVIDQKTVKKLWSDKAAKIYQVRSLLRRVAMLLFCSGVRFHSAPSLSVAVSLCRTFPSVAPFLSRLDAGAFLGVRFHCVHSLSVAPSTLMHLLSLVLLLVPFPVLFSASILPTPSLLLCLSVDISPSLLHLPLCSTFSLSLSLVSLLGIFPCSV